MSVRGTADFERVLQAINRGQDDDQCLSGRHYNERYWRNAKAALGRIALQLDRASGERDAFSAALAGTPSEGMVRTEYGWARPCAACGSTDFGKPCPNTEDGFHVHVAGTPSEDTE